MKNITLNSKEKKIIDELNHKDDIALINSISLLNTHVNFKKFKPMGINLENILYYACELALHKNLSIDTKGYIDLIDIIKEVK